jgi:hypothetical protein
VVAKTASAANVKAEMFFISNFNPGKVFSPEIVFKLPKV